MVEKLMHRYALSRRGAKDLIKGVLACTLQDISFMFPVMLLYLFVKDLLADNIKGKALFYIIGAVACMLLIFLITLWQYNSTFLATYVETGTRRISLAEKLRKIPLSYFSKKDLADLTNTIMADCTYLETAFSHFIPPFAGSMISTVLVAVSLFFFQVKMALASLWVLPVSLFIVASSAKIQQKLSQKSMNARMDAENGIQECIDTVADLKLNNAQERYLISLDQKIDHVSFAYNDNTKVLDDISFTAKQGEITALVGPSGGGKTTVSRLATRFWDASGGKITVGGMDISKVDPETLLGLYSIVFQDVTLFNTSVMENIRLGKKNATASLDVENADKIVVLSDGKLLKVIHRINLCRKTVFSDIWQIFRQQVKTGQSKPDNKGLFIESLFLNK